MKQHKVVPITPNPSSTRQEIDAYLKQITRLVEKNPKKIAAVFKAWIDTPAKASKSKRAA